MAETKKNPKSAADKWDEGDYVGAVGQFLKNTVDPSINSRYAPEEEKGDKDRKKKVLPPGKPKSRLNEV